jgi:putative ABC transport system permease protein
VSSQEFAKLSQAMLKNYFKIALRNLVKRKAFSLINILGLSTGIASCLLIGAFIVDELSYDRFPIRADRIYRVELSVLGNKELAEYPMVDMAVGPGIRNAFPEVESSTRILNLGESFVRNGNRQFKEMKFAYADSNLLNIFSLALVEGDGQKALEKPNSLVISKSLAIKYFGSLSVLGKTLTIDDKPPLQITAVMEDMPVHSHFHYDALISMSTLHFPRETWSNVGIFTYLVLQKGTDPKKLEARFRELVEKYVVPEFQHDMGVSYAEARKSSNTFRFHLTSLRNIHLYAHSKYELEPNGDIQNVYIFGALAVFILLLGCANFTNLSTAASAGRAREVGIRKVVGSLKSQLIFQFLTESILLAIGATLIAYLLVFLSLPYFNQLSGKQVAFPLFLRFPALSGSFLLAILVGLMAGIYPAFYLSAFRTIKVLKGAVSKLGSSKGGLRSSLVVFQFLISIALIVSTLVVYRQLHYMQVRKLGYDREQVLFLPDAYLLGANQVPFKQQLLRDGRVTRVSMSRNLPGSGNMGGTEIYPKTESSGNGKEIHTNIFFVDYDYVPTMGMHILEGRNFSKDFPTDSNGVLINQAAVHELGLEKPGSVGRTIVRSGQKQFQVVGVVEDFHYASVKEKIAPLIMLLVNNTGGMIVRIKSTDISGFLSDLEKEWAQFNPSGPFSFYFLDDKFNSLYSAETRTGAIFSAFTLIAILIAGLGLFGLAAHVTEQRTKEIGIRKVLGASVGQVLLLVSKEFLYLISLAFLISIPMTYWVMQKWLQDFAYRVGIEWWIFAVAGLGATFLAILIISLQTIRAAVANPVDSLRAE